MSVSLVDSMIDSFDDVAAKGEYIFVRSLPTEEKTSGGIIIPDDTKKVCLASSMLVEVLSIGEKAFTNALGEKVSNEPPIEVGDWIVVTKFSGQSIKKENRDYRFILYGSVMGKIEDEETLNNINNYKV